MTQGGLARQIWVAILLSWLGSYKGLGDLDGMEFIARPN